jgi:hypothetical protein
MFAQPHFQGRAPRSSAASSSTWPARSARDGVAGQAPCGRCQFTPSSQGCRLPPTGPFARGLQLRTVTEWRKYVREGLPHLSRKPIDIPSNPYMAYIDEGWAGWPDWLGTTKD